MVDAEMKDLTVIYLTVNRMPAKWTEFHRFHLEKATAGFPKICLSRIPTDFGYNEIQEEPYNYVNIYKQLLRGAMMADTPFVGVAEDDSLYSPDHYRCFRPDMDTAAYNFARWSVFSWQPEFYSLRLRQGNFGLIASRALVVEALTERFERWGDNWPAGYEGEIGRNSIELGLRVKQRKWISFFSPTSVVQLSHPKGLEERQQRMRKAHSTLRAFDVPYWGKSVDIAKYYTEGDAE
jgi:hypothetical protein